MDITQFWRFIKSLEGNTIYTLTTHQPNKIVLVEDTGRDSDTIVFEGRDTMPTKLDVWEAYQILVNRRKLIRVHDLEWLKRKRVSSIVFALLAELSGVRVVKEGRKTILTIEI